MSASLSEDELLARALQAAEEGPNPYLYSSFAYQFDASEDDDEDYSSEKKAKRKAKKKVTPKQPTRTNSKNIQQPSAKTGLELHSLQPHTTEDSAHVVIIPEIGEEKPTTSSTSRKRSQRSTTSHVSNQTIEVDSKRLHKSSEEKDAADSDAIRLEGAIETHEKHVSKEAKQNDGHKFENKGSAEKKVIPVSSEGIYQKSDDDGFNHGTWMESEEVAFKEALELYGRDWRKIEAHVKTRDPRSIRSYAQKHFVRLYCMGLPLPKKVALSGDGYTLSGKPLSPDCSILKMYSGKSNKLRRFASNSVNSKVEADAQETENEIPSSAESSAVANASSPPASQNSSISVKRASTMESPTAKTRRSQKNAEKIQQPEVSPMKYTDEAAEGRISRERRKCTTKTFASYNFGSEELDPLQMVQCLPFVGDPGSNQPNSQPFTMDVHIDAIILADFHAHLSTSEVIGFLAGRWNPETKHIEVSGSYPCKSLDVDEDTVNVEMDPTSAFEVRETISEAGLSVVGWYHSHPTFQPDPSIRDVQNQTSYQHLCRDETHSTEPFVGLIIGPYDSRLPSCQSATNWFYVGNAFENRGKPMALSYQTIQSSHNSEHLLLRIVDLQGDVTLYPKALKLGDMWPRLLPVLRSLEAKAEFKQVSRGEKLFWSIASRLSEQKTHPDFLQKLRAIIDVPLSDGDAQESSNSA